MPSRTEKTPFGDITMTSDGKAITGITWADEVSANDGSDAILDKGFRQLKEYADGKRQKFDVPVSLAGCTDELKKWLEVLRQVPHGTTLSYTEFAEKAGFPRVGAKVAGWACANNPLPIIYPCHRVLKRNGTLGNFGAYKNLRTSHPRNLAVKEQLIRHEQGGKIPEISAKKTNSSAKKTTRSRTEKTPFGFITMTSNGKAITGITWADEGVDEMPADDGSDAILDEGFQQLKEYADGKRKKFDVPVSMAGHSKELKKWLWRLHQVPYGTTLSYEEFAKKTEFPHASVRVAKWACANNPLQIIYPCHRVLRANGQLGNFGAYKNLETNHPRNLAVKEQLINHEKGIKTFISSAGTIMRSRTEETPFGFITMTSNGEAITSIFWVSEMPENGKSDAILKKAFRQLNEYAKGKRQEFDVPVSLDECSDEHRKWLEVLRKVPYGSTISYKQLATMAKKSPNASRAAGSACANNPLPIIYPCHRIVRVDGSLGNFGAYKHLETDAVENLNVKGQLINLENYFSNGKKSQKPQATGASAKKIIRRKTRATLFGKITMTSNGKAITSIDWTTRRPENSMSDAILDKGFQQLEEYIRGKRQEFDVPVSLDECSDEHRHWLEVLRQVPYGTTISYAELAEKAGFSRKSAKAAGLACKKNHLPIIYPCHRILTTDGKLGNFGGHKTLKSNDPRNLNIKERLISHEKNNKKKNLSDTKKEEPQPKSSSIQWWPLALAGGALAWWLLS